MNTYRLLHSAADMLTEIAGLPMLLGNYAFVNVFNLFTRKQNSQVKQNPFSLADP